MANTPPNNPALEAKDLEQSELFRSRLAKRARHLRRWPRKRGITCFRLYERDIPEIPLVVDRYEDHLHITEYDRPHERSPWRHAAWLELMRRTAAETLDLPVDHTHLKSRQRVRDGAQYEKLDSQGGMMEVHEGGLKFLANLTDYVDTGLFLDHRLTRSMVREQAKGKRFLNLFAYTGSFTVYAAAGGATASVTVDLSKNYTEWAKRNLEINGFAGPSHRFVASDTIEFLHKAIESETRFDLCVVDPPTFSNSKRTEQDWDVQRRHVELLTLVSKVMSPQGVVWFSTNFRRFKFAEDELQGFAEIREVSRQTVPEDFRNQRIHRCWRLLVEG